MFRPIIFLGLCMTYTDGLVSTFCRQPYVSSAAATGDTDNVVNIALFYDLHHSSSGTKCDVINPTSFQEMEAFHYVFDQLNKLDYIPGVRLGTIVYDTCSRSDITSRHVRHLLAKLDNRQYCEQCATSLHAGGDLANHTSCSDNDMSSLLFGIAGPSTSEVARTVAGVMREEIADNQLIQISHSATAAILTTDDKFANVYSVIPPDNFQAQVIIEILRKLEWNYIAVIYTDDTYGRQGAKALKELAGKYDVCIPFLEKLPSDFVDKILVQRMLDRLDGVNDRDKQPVGGAVYFGNAHNAEEILYQRNGNSIFRKIKFIFSDSLNMKPLVMKMYETAASGSLLLSPAYQNLTNVMSHWGKLLWDNDYASRSDRPWLKELYKEYFNCSRIDLCPSRNIKHVGALTTLSAFSYYSVQVAFIYAKLIKSLHSKLCAGRTGLCAQLMQLPRKQIRAELTTLEFNFGLDFNKSVVPVELRTYPTLAFQEGGRTLIPNGLNLYSIHQFQRDCGCIKKVGSYSLDHLVLGETNLFQKAVCGEGFACQMCIPRYYEKKWIYYNPGDVIIVGLVPVVNTGSHPLSCGSIRVYKGFQLAEALIYAVEKANAKQGIFSKIFPGNLTVGLLILNTCHNDALATREMFAVMAEHDPSLPKKVIGVIGSLSSDVSKTVAQLLTKLRNVQISYASTSVLLSQRHEFPYFMRTCTPDSTQALIIIKLLKELEWSYISIVYVDDSYGTSGFAALKQSATANKVCIAFSMPVDDSTNFYHVLDELRKTPSARVVVLFIRLKMATAMLKAFSEKSNFRQGEFVFILTESVGNRKSLFRGNPAALGALSLLQDVALDKGFDQYLSTKGVDSTALLEQFWLQEYLERFLECYMPLSFNKSSSNQCAKGTKWTSSHKYEQDPWAPFVINAVYSLVLGADKAFKDLCLGSRTICDNFRNNPELLISRIKETRLDLFNSGNVSVFDDNGEGNVRFKIFNVQLNPLNHSTLRYEEVGNSTHFAHGPTIRLVKQRLRFPDSEVIPTSRCPNSLECSRCQKSFENNQSTSDENLGPLQATCICLGILLLVCLSLLILVCRKYWRKEKAQRKKNRQPQNIDIDGYSEVHLDRDCRHLPTIPTHESYDSKSATENHPRNQANLSIQNPTWDEDDSIVTHVTERQVTYYMCDRSSVYI